MYIEKNRKFPGWWTLYADGGKPMTSSTTYASVKAHYDAIIRDTRAKEVLDLQCFAEDVRPKISRLTKAKTDASAASEAPAHGGSAELK